MGGGGHFRYEFDWPLERVLPDTLFQRNAQKMASGQLLIISYMN